ncbi:MAG TPA: gephyrin-like molybdotransferase Glp [Terriglobales bacterium]|nr:gephyrin-like molybdotransferase Glp [Terriglobales bacterium]
MLSFEEARYAVEREAQAWLEANGCSLKSERIPLLKSRGRILAEEIRADRDIPPFNRAARDGYALRASDIAAASENSPVVLKVVGEIAAGARELLVVHRGEAAEIMTGAPAPEGADAVVMVEYTRSDSAGQVQVQRPVKSGENIAPLGCEAKQDQRLLEAGQCLSPAAIAVAASLGCRELAVYARPTVAVLATGDELVDVGQQPSPHQIRNSNAYSLAAQIEAAGGDALLLPIAPDEPKRLRALIQQGLAADLLLLSGGVSAGKYDLVEPVLAELGAEFIFTGAKIQPGKPIVFGKNQNTLASTKHFFGLPGNPVSTLVTFDLFVRPMLDALCGTVPSPLQLLKARLAAEVRAKTGLTRFLPARLVGECGQTQVEPVRWHGSGDIVATAGANCYIVVPPEREVIRPGEMVSVLPRS